MYKKFNTAQSGQISVEASIIVPVIMIVTASFIYMAFYAHDIISIRSGAYGMAVEYDNSNALMPALFVINPKITKTENSNRNIINIAMDSDGNTNFINNIIHRKTDETLTVQKTMNCEILYAIRALLDTKKEGEN